ncbi:hypothetical protein GCM10010176_039390 [Nonomuraea spiralis]|nr:hypothetical protein GCM10010176_039390 [Nonomuraea spiralis]
MVSWVSTAMPEACPYTRRAPLTSWRGATFSGSVSMPTVISSPRLPSPSIVADIAAELVTVASTTLAPPSSSSSPATCPAAPSM